MMFNLIIFVTGGKLWLLSTERKKKVTPMIVSEMVNTVMSKLLAENGGNKGN